jgi:hypothetical protein
MELSPEGCVPIIRYELETWEPAQHVLEKRREPAKAIAGLLVRINSALRQIKCPPKE